MSAMGPSVELARSGGLHFSLLPMRWHRPFNEFSPFPRLPAFAVGV